MDKPTNKIDHDNLHQALRNWGRWLNMSMLDAEIPSQHPEAAQWQQDYRAENQDDPDRPEPVDEDWAERVQKGVVRLAIENVNIRIGNTPIAAHAVLTKFYRDGWENQSRYINWARVQLWRVM